MTYADFTSSRPSIWAIVSAPFRALGNAMMFIAENNSRMAAVQKLNELTDEQLAARGTTRAAEVQRIFASMGAL